MPNFSPNLIIKGIVNFINGIIAGTEVATANAPLKPGESVFSEFIPGEPGTYYYICTVPGHRDMGMVGTIIVE